MGILDGLVPGVGSSGSAGLFGGFGLPILSTIGSMGSTLLQNYENRAMVEQQENFQAGMADSVYQRGVADLEKAGLNPVLAASGATDPAPGGAMQTMQALPNPMGTMIDSASKVASARQLSNAADVSDVDAATAKGLLRGTTDPDGKPLMDSIIQSEADRRIAAGAVANSNMASAKALAQTNQEEAHQASVRSKLLDMSIPLATNASMIQKNAPFLNWVDAISSSLSGSGAAMHAISKLAP